MRRTAIAGAFSLALTLGACAAKQQPAPPPLNLVTEAEPTAAAAPAAPTPEQILAGQPPEVQEAVKKHDEEWQVANLQDTGLHALSVQPGPPARRRLRAAADYRHSAPAGRDHHRRCFG